ncbi:MAG: NHLP bacteriocin system secretion protein, partial [Holophagales bacterium]|nr:NHLP bacteriocin system secretion protein [Holophagales bacterium]
ADLEVDNASASFAQIERKIGSTTRVSSEYNGRVLEVMTEPGQIVQRGQPVLSLDLEGNVIQDLIAVIFVPSVHGKKIKPGMEIQIAPTTVAQEEFGMMLGRVTFASNYPATPRGMQRVLKNQQLVAALSAGGAPYEIHAELVVDPNTLSQYRWTSSEGPPTRIQSGTVAAGFITVKSQRPIARLLPILRKWSGIGA